MRTGSASNFCGRLTIATDFIIADSGEPDPVVLDAPQTPVDLLPDELMIFLIGSRYCETDKLMDTAWSLFGNTPPGWRRVQAICDYVHQWLTFGYPYARPTKTAAEAFALGELQDQSVGLVSRDANLPIGARFVIVDEVPRQTVHL